jgi:hypothetical protein
MITLIVGVELMLFIKHSKGQFIHAYFEPKAVVFLGILLFLAVFVLMKVIVSDLINLFKLKDLKRKH